MKNFFSLLVISIFLQVSAVAQNINFTGDFVLNNPVMIPSPGVFPGSETITFDFYVTQAYTFTNNPLSNDYATITFSFTKMNPTGLPPTGTGAALYYWVLTDNGGTGVNKVYTWTGTTLALPMAASPPALKYKIVFTNIPVTFAATSAQADIRVAGQFTDPGNAPTGNTINNSAVISTYTTLPVKLLSFNAAKQGNTVDLKWQTTSEENSNYFDVQFSQDGTNWQSIGKVQAAGNSTIQQSYIFNHSTTVKGANYYRLKEVNKDGNFLYSEVRVINFDGKGLITILPNPVIDRVYITSSIGTLLQSVRLFNSTGEQLQQYTNFTSGNSISMSKYPAGTYVIKIIDKDGNTQASKIVKQ